MRLYTFKTDGQFRLGAECGGLLVDLPAAHAALVEMRRIAPLPAFGPDMLSFLGQGEPALAAARHVLELMAKRPALRVDQPVLFPFDDVQVLAPIPRPGKILCSGINYLSHKQENPEAKLPSSPFFFAKMPSGVIGPGERIICPAETQQLDYEVELAVVIGRRMTQTPEGGVMACVAGYTILHDVSARDVQFKDNQLTLGKNFDTFCPMGPCVVTTDELPDLSGVGLRSFVNGELMQNGSTGDWLFSLPVLLGRLSHVMTLEPGDVVSTGTPAGVGVFRKPPRFLSAGDVVRLEIDGIGSLENPVAAAAPPVSSERETPGGGGLGIATSP